MLFSDVVTAITGLKGDVTTDKDITPGGK
jgi:hypothetical protein